MAGEDAKVVSLQDFVELGFRPLCEQLAGGGMPEHAVVICVPSQGMLKLYSGLAPKPRAELIERMADQLKTMAAELRKQPGGSVFVPNDVKLKAPGQ